MEMNIEDFYELLNDIAQREYGKQDFAKTRESVSSSTFESDYGSGSIGSNKGQQIQIVHQTTHYAQHRLNINSKNHPAV